MPIISTSSPRAITHAYERSFQFCLLARLSMRICNEHSLLIMNQSIIREPRQLEYIARHCAVHTRSRENPDNTYICKTCAQRAVPSWYSNMLVQGLHACTVVDSVRQIYVHSK